MLMVVSGSLAIIMGVFFIMIMRMAVLQVPMAVFMIMLRFIHFGFIPKTSATFAHISLQMLL